MHGCADVSTTSWSYAGSPVGALKPNLYFVTHRHPRGLQCRTAHANAKAAASDEHRAAGERYAVKRAGHPHLTAPTQLGDQVKGNVDHGEAAWLVLPPAANTSAKQHHDSSHRVEAVTNL